MPPSYGLMTDRLDAAPLFQEDFLDEIWKNATVASLCLSLFRSRRMTSAQTRVPVLATKASAFWITGDTGLKPTTEIGWGNTYINAEELAAVVVIPDNVVDDADFPLWDEYRPELEEAAAVLIDDTILGGIAAPGSFPAGIVPAANAAGNTIVAGTSTVDWLDDVNNMIGLVEADGYMVDTLIGKLSLQARLRGLRDANKGFLVAPAGPAGSSAANQRYQGQLFGVNLELDQLGLQTFATGTNMPEVIGLDKDAFVIGRRKDLTFKTADTGVITAADGSIVINLFQQDASALRMVMRIGWQVKNPVSRIAPNATGRYPAGVVVSA